MRRGKHGENEIDSGCAVVDNAIMTLSAMARSRPHLLGAGLVVAVVLAGAVMAWRAQSGVVNTGSAPAQAEIAVISAALEQFKSEYGEYPPGGASPRAEENLAKALTGRARWEHTADGKLVWDAATPMSAPAPNWGKPVIDLKNFKFERDASGNLAGDARLLDYWGHPLLYRYKSTDEITNQGTTPAIWKGTTFVLVSRGPDGLPKDPDANFVWRNAISKGVLAEDYFEGPGSKDRADNVVSADLNNAPAYDPFNVRDDLAN